MNFWKTCYHCITDVTLDSHVNGIFNVPKWKQDLRNIDTVSNIANLFLLVFNSSLLAGIFIKNLETGTRRNFYIQLVNIFPNSIPTFCYLNKKFYNLYNFLIKTYIPIQLSVKVLSKVHGENQRVVKMIFLLFFIT